MNGSPWRKADVALLRYHAQRKVRSERIARMLGRSLSAVYTKAKMLGIPLSKRGPDSKYDESVAREAVRRYFAGSESQQEIADSLGVPRGSVQRWCNGKERPYLRREYAP